MTKNINDVLYGTNQVIGINCSSKFDIDLISSDKMIQVVLMILGERSHMYARHHTPKAKLRSRKNSIPRANTM